jgi:hypothetical protein
VRDLSTALSDKKRECDRLRAELAGQRAEPAAALALLPIAAKAAVRGVVVFGRRVGRDLTGGGVERRPTRAR